jgi:hypothetical protein
MGKHMEACVSTRKKLMTEAAVMLFEELPYRDKVDVLGYLLKKQDEEMKIAGLIDLGEEDVIIPELREEQDKHLEELRNSPQAKANEARSEKKTSFWAAKRQQQKKEKAEKEAAGKSGNVAGKQAESAPPITQVVVKDGNTPAAKDASSEHPR